MIQLKVHGKISIATAHRLGMHVKQIFSHVKIMRRVCRIIKYYIIKLRRVLVNQLWNNIAVLATGSIEI